MIANVLFTFASITSLIVGARSVVDFLRPSIRPRILDVLLASITITFGLACAWVVVGRLGAHG